MELAIKKQMATVGYIQRFWENLIKVGKEKLTRVYLTTRLGLLESYWARFLSAHDELLSFDEIDNSRYMKDDVYTKTEDSYVEMKTRLSAYMPTAKDAAGGNGDSSSVLKYMQLPKQDLPTFNGDQLSWVYFRDLFKSLVHDVEGLPPVQKLQYLKACLTGEAAEVVDNIEMSADGYALAWEELGQRYDNRRVLLATHMRVLLSAPSLTKPDASDINRLIVMVKRASRSFRSLGRPVEHWDDWFVHILLEKLDSATKLLWESSRKTSQDFPSFKDLEQFLYGRTRGLDAAGPRSLQQVAPTAKPKQSGRKSDVSSHATSTTSDQADKGVPCPMCREQHSMRYCAKFKALSVEQRRDHSRKKRACFNCLGQGHLASACPSVNRCRHCNEKHHTLLHVTGSNKGQSTLKASSSSITQCGTSDVTTAIPVVEDVSKVAMHSSSTRGTVLLATALVTLIAPSGKSVEVKALLDSGSEASFVTERVAQLLGLTRRRVSVTVSGMQGVNTGTAKHSVSLMIGTRRSPTVRIPLTRALVLAGLTPLTPGHRIPRGSWPHLQGLCLADPQFHVPSQVDVVLGADVYGMLLDNGIKRGLPGEPYAHLTVFGWVLMGAIGQPEDTSSMKVAVHHAAVYSDLHQALQRFWELESVPSDRILTPEEAHCEEHFMNTHSRDAAGRYMVRLPKKEDASVVLGSSRAGALRVLQSTERRTERDPMLREKYNDFMAMYFSLGHMETIQADDVQCGQAYYLPHHAVFKANEPARIRVVFNASFRTSSGVSLNDVLLPGPKLQTDLWLILTRWRFHRFAFATDLVKMFRQIRVHPDDADLQRILWRSDPAARIQDFRLTTVTYGTAPAPYLAIRTLLQLAQDEGARYPLGSNALRLNTYVDDILAGAGSLEDALEVKRQLTELLSTEGFQLSRWTGTHAALCPDGDGLDRLFSSVDGVSTLGVLWSPDKDLLSLRAVPALSSIQTSTKRTILSDVARFFDPIGWAAPVLIVAKVLLQDLWMAGLNWDEPLPEVLRTRWMTYVDTLPGLSQLAAPRWLGISAESNFELHGFADASTRAYAAAVYVRGTCMSGATVTRLLVAKTKVAPVKPVSIPRLELCGALLVARLLQRVATDLGCHPDSLHAWTDARVVLAWIRAHPSRWKPFVANRVASIQEIVPAGRWRFVPTAENPADVATRGVTPKELAIKELWWRGPPWLAHAHEQWPDDHETQDSEGAERRNLVALRTHEAEQNDLLLRFSSLTRLIRITSLCLRFGQKRESRTESMHCLSASELQATRLRWLKIAQRQDYPKEIEALSRGRPLPRGSTLLSLRPIMGPDGLLRVGGRLQHAPLPYDERHPVILAKSNHLALLLVRDAHHRTLHGGPQLTRSVLLRRYWIVRANSLVRAEIHRCVTCVRFRGRTAHQQMGQLPDDRVRACRPFLSAGVDYAGPIQLRVAKGRGHKTFKGYICLFVCMASRAVHLEAVTDLTSASFLAAFKRFQARRGHCARLLSDNATNFRGAERELRTLFNAAADFYKECRSQLDQDGTDWKFIPPSAPHFGGLWEAGIKATKHHLRRVLGEHLLTYEELATLLCQVEACLNSRPLHPMNSDPSDLTALISGHFLIGEVLIVGPERPRAVGHGTSRANYLALVADCQHEGPFLAKVVL